MALWPNAISLKLCQFDSVSALFLVLRNRLVMHFVGSLHLSLQWHLDLLGCDKVPRQSIIDMRALNSLHIPHHVWFPCAVKEATFWPAEPAMQFVLHIAHRQADNFKNIQDKQQKIQKKTKTTCIVSHIHSTSVGKVIMVFGHNLNTHYINQNCYETNKPNQTIKIFGMFQPRQMSAICRHGARQMKTTREENYVSFIRKATTKKKIS